MSRQYSCTEASARGYMMKMLATKVDFPCLRKEGGKSRGKSDLEDVSSLMAFADTYKTLLISILIRLMSMYPFHLCPVLLGYYSPPKHRC